MPAKSQPAPTRTAPPDGEGMAARKAALAVLQAAVARRGGFDEAMAQPGFSDLPLRERAFARALATTTLRRLGAIDAALAARLQTPPPEAVNWLLRLGTAQVLFMETAAHAAVSITVDQAAADPRTRPYKGLVNAVLRGLARDPQPPAPAEALAPPWLLARWRAAYGETDALAIAAAIAEEPATDLTPRDPADLPALAEAMEGEAVGGSVRTRKRGDLADWPGFAEGRWWVQDAAAALPCRLLGPRPGEAVLDMCAAPGGKTMQLAAAGARVVALDRSAARLKRVSENLARLSLEAELVAADGGAWPDPRTFDAVLLDAPCSATGTFRRHPDVLWVARASDIGKLAAIQARLLDSAADRVRPGGRLVYCVCSLEPEEGEAQAAAFLHRRPDFAMAPVRSGEAGLTSTAITGAGAVRLLPGRPGQGVDGDGFFVARLVRSPA